MVNKGEHDAQAKSIATGKSSGPGIKAHTRAEKSFRTR